MRELSLNVLDVAQNSVAADAKNIEIEALLDTAKKTLLLGIYDDGKGDIAVWSSPSLRNKIEE